MIEAKVTVQGLDRKTIFDAGDIDYLVLKLSEAQLKRECHSAEVNLGACRCLGEDDELLYWQHYQKAIELAIEIVSSNRLPTKPIAGRIDVNQIKQRTDIVSVIEGYTTLRKSGSRFTGRCPIHQDKHPSLTVYADNQSWHCFGCSKGGDVIAFIQAVEKIDFRGAVAILGVCNDGTKRS